MGKRGNHILGIELRKALVKYTILLLGQANGQQRRINKQIFSFKLCLTRMEKT